VYLTIVKLSQSSSSRRRHPKPPLPEAIILVLASFARLLSTRVWLHFRLIDYCSPISVWILEINFNGHKI
jgi:hypothetical protein